MLEVEEHILIRKPAGEVFAFLTNPHNAPLWRVGLLEARQLSAGEMAVGTIIEESVQVLGQRLRSRVEVLEFEADKQRRLRVRLGPLPIELLESYEETPNGTLLRVRGSAQVSGVQRLAARAALGQVKRQLGQELANIKRVLERTESSA